MTYGSHTLTYRQLDRVTNALAARLLELNVGIGSVLAIHADRDVSVVVAMLASIKAGGAYLPLDPGQPVLRLRKMAAEGRPVAVLTCSTTFDDVGLGVTVIPVAQYISDAVKASPACDARVNGGAGPNDLAYVMYTSGSSGSPKGICVTHRNVVRLVRNTNYVDFHPGIRVAQISNAAFDASTFEIWGALLNGGELVGFDRDVILDPLLLKAALRHSNINVMVMATPLFNQLAANSPDVFSSVSQLFVGGDVMAVDQARSVAALTGCTLVNGYGPTECTTFATAFEVTSVSSDIHRIPIGRPISNTTCYVLDDLMRLQPVGVPGQLYIGGDGVARGYLDRPELTADRFIPDPFATEVGSRMFATLDLVRLLPDGALDFLGRADLQIKIRGFLVEPAEVDAALVEHHAISEAATIVVGTRPEDKTLASAYVSTGPDTPDTSEITAFLRQRLPDYMIPSRLIRVAELPKNSNSKIDRARLLEVVTSEQTYVGVPSQADIDPVAATVADMIADVLAVARFGTRENFFDSGGHSLLAIRLLTQVRNRFNVNVALSEFFDDPTASGIAACVQQSTADDIETAS